MNLIQAEKSLHRSGTYYDPVSRISVKIVQHQSGDGYAVETTVNGDRRLPVEDPMPLEEARRLALAQLVDPRERFEYTPSKNDHMPSPKPTTLPSYSPGLLIIEYKRKGLGRQEAWSQFIRDTILQPTCRSENLNARDFFHLYDRY